jgi:hypothetical protein
MGSGWEWFPHSRSSSGLGKTRLLRGPVIGYLLLLIRLSAAEFPSLILRQTTIVCRSLVFSKCRTRRDHYPPPSNSGVQNEEHPQPSSGLRICHPASDIHFRTHPMLLSHALASQSHTYSQLSGPDRDPPSRTTAPHEIVHAESPSRDLDVSCNQPCRPRVFLNGVLTVPCDRQYAAAAGSGARSPPPTR